MALGFAYGHFHFFVLEVTVVTLHKVHCSFGTGLRGLFTADELLGVAVAGGCDLNGLTADLCVTDRAVDNILIGTLCSTGGCYIVLNNNCRIGVTQSIDCNSIAADFLTAVIPLTVDYAVIGTGCGTGSCNFIFLYSFFRQVALGGITGQRIISFTVLTLVVRIAVLFTGSGMIGRLIFMVQHIGIIADIAVITAIGGTFIGREALCHTGGGCHHSIVGVRCLFDFLVLGLTALSTGVLHVTGSDTGGCLGDHTLIPGVGQLFGGSLSNQHFVTDGAVLAFRQTGGLTSCGNCFIYHLGVRQLIGNSLSNQHFAADVAMAALGQTGGLTGGGNSGIHNSGMAGGRNFFGDYITTVTGLFPFAGDSTGGIGYDFPVTMAVAGGSQSFLGLIAADGTGPDHLTGCGTGGILPGNFLGMIMVTGGIHSHNVTVQFRITDRAVDNAVILARLCTGGSLFIFSDRIGILVAESRNDGLGNQNFITYGAVLAFRLTVNGTGSSNALVNNLSMTGCRNLFPCNQNFTTLRAVLAFCQTSGCTGSSNALVNNLSMTGNLVNNAGFLVATDRTGMYFLAVFRTGFFFADGPASITVSIAADCFKNLVNTTAILTDLDRLAVCCTGGICYNSILCVIVMAGGIDSGCLAADFCLTDRTVNNRIIGTLFFTGGFHIVLHHSIGIGMAGGGNFDNLTGFILYTAGGAEQVLLVGACGGTGRCNLIILLGLGCILGMVVLLGPHGIAVIPIFYKLFCTCSFSIGTVCILQLCRNNGNFIIFVFFLL